MSGIIRRSTEIARKQGMPMLIRKVWLYIVNLCWALHYTLFLKKMTRGYGLSESVDFVFNGCHGLIRPFQDRHEVAKMAEIVRARTPDAILEIGTATGGTLFIFSRTASKDAFIMSIDLPEGRFGGGYPFWKIPLYRSFAVGNQKISLLRSDSHNDNTLYKVKVFFGERPVDLLYIDGDHTYEGVKKDFEMYGPLVRKGGLIIFHDIAVNPPEQDCGVHKFWAEIKDSHKNSEIIADMDQKGAGIGVLFVE